METCGGILQADGREMQGSQRVIWENGRIRAFYGKHIKGVDWEVWGNKKFWMQQLQFVKFLEGGHRRLGKLMEWETRLGVGEEVWKGR